MSGIIRTRITARTTNIDAWVRPGWLLRATSELAIDTPVIPPACRNIPRSPLIDAALLGTS